MAGEEFFFSADLQLAVGAGKAGNDAETVTGIAVINLDDIQYSYSGSGQKKGQNGGAQDGTGQGTQQDYPTGQSQPSSYPATGQSQPPAAPPASSGAMQLAEPIKYNYKRQRAHMKSEPSTPCALFFAF